MKSKQIVDLTEEQVAFKEVLHRFDFQTDKIVEFFSQFLDVSCKDPRDRLYKNIAQKMLPLDA